MIADTKREPLAPGATIGILGGGQLGRMMALAAARLGLQSHVYCPDDDSPASQVAAVTTVAPYEDETALAGFAAQVDVVTYEFESVPVSAAQVLDRLVPVRPSPQALSIAQDRFLEKSFLRDAGIATAQFAAVSSTDDFDRALADLGVPAVLKTRRFGYDGKGQTFIADQRTASEGWASICGTPAILEAFVPFDRELSVIAARDIDGRTASYDPVLNVHERHVLVKSIVPAGISRDLAADARALAERIADQLDYVGVIGVEFFHCAGGRERLLVNEIAPRVHNSGHWTLDACVISQFEQHVRAICGWPLGSTRRIANVVMTNLLGDAINDWFALGGAPDTAVHIYGKRGIVPGRKMGHMTRLLPLGTELEREATDVDARTTSTGVPNARAKSA